MAVLRLKKYYFIGLLMLGLLSCKGKWHKADTDQPPTQKEVQDFFLKRWANDVEDDGFQNPHFIIINFKQTEPYRLHYKKYGALTTFQIKMDALFSKENEYSVEIINEWDHFVQFYRNKDGDLVIRDNSIGSTNRQWARKPDNTAKKALMQ